MRSSAWLLATVLIFSCTRRSPGAEATDAAPSAQPRARPEPAPRAAPAPKPAQAAEPGEAASADSAQTSQASRSLGHPPPRGCRAGPPTAFGEGVTRVFLPPQTRALDALVLRSDRTSLEWWSDAGGSLSRVATHRAKAKIERLSLTRKAAAMYVFAWVDEKGDVFKQAFAGGAFGEPKRVGQGADRRFAPALFEPPDAELLAYTATVDEAMHTFVVAGSASPRDITPLGHGAAAPSFVVGRSEPLLVVVDARAGVSPLLSFAFDAAGKAAPVKVRTPISQPYTPPLLRAVALPGGAIEVAFTAVGKLAATAIGRVPLERAVDAVALYPSRGYGELSFEVALSGNAAVFAAEVPKSAEPGAPRGIEIAWLDAKGQGETLALEGSGASGSSPSIAATPASGELRVGYTHEERAEVLPLVCDG